ncbi:Flagellar basal-body rod protein FlgG [Planctomycetes bacterium Poly30]|uniref:Flagellar basal-body rod protein FlgG n=1 Tax=Saltatorellus ferox TaxID=2528018 RepID=A0A518EMF8_9BACT|nr:Flagellar basal-body rod protein FlgG [Planctomycetes bacterium Poly30]
MLKHITPAFTVLLLAACQSAATTTEAEGPWRTQVEQNQEEFRRKIDGLHTLLVAKGSEPQGGMELISRVVALGDQLNHLGALIADSRGGQVSSAAFASWAPARGGANRDIEVLKEALLVAESQRALHVENIANAGVPGYKRRRLQSATRMIEREGSQAPEIRGTVRDMRQGVLDPTEDPLDFAIEGPGFFELQRPDGSLLYRRDGRFRPDFNGRLVTSEGFLLTGDVVLHADAVGITVAPDGQVLERGARRSYRQAGRMQVHTFFNAGGLAAQGGNYYAPTASSGQAKARQPGAEEAGLIQQGHVERSNVNLTDEAIALQLIDRRAAAIRLALSSRGVFVP